MKSPRIASLEWGFIEVEGFGKLRDVKLFPGGAKGWDWLETGTHHSPGIQPADVTELITSGAETVLISRGVWKRLKTMPKTVALLEQAGMTVHQLQTEACVEEYNTLREREQVAALIHTTC